MKNISRVFQKLKDKNEGALIGYITAGDPNPKFTTKLANALIKGGIDILELGLPFSDPIADGPTIQAASLRALNAETTPTIVLELAKEIKQKHSLPILVMTYYNPIFRMGLENFFSKAKTCMVDGIIVPDLPIEEADDYKKTAAKKGIDTVFLAAPSTTDERLAEIVASSSGFLYLVSHFGVTGAKTSVEDSTVSLVKHVREFTTEKLPLAVGFGVSKPEHVKSLIAAGADGVIVGSVFVNIVSKNLSTPERMLQEIEDTARRLKKATLQ